jgi:hypothetical protein
MALIYDRIQAAEQESGGSRDQRMRWAKTIRILAVLAGLTAALGCEFEDRSEVRVGLIEDVEVLDAGPTDALPSLSWRVGEKPRLRIGGPREDAAHHFVEVTAAIVDPNGTVVIADGAAGSLRRYGPEGEFRQQLGAVGDGPGEFRSPSSLAWLPGDSLAVWDRTLWRMSVLDGQGSFVRTEHYDPTAAGVYPLEGMWPGELKLTNGGTLLLRLISKSKGKASGTGEDADTGLAVHRPGAPTAELLAMLPGEVEVEVEAPWGAVSLAPPLAGGPVLAFDPASQRACMGHQVVSEILCVDPGGERAGVRWVDRRRAVDPEDPSISRWRSDMERAFGGKIGRQQAEELASQVSIPRWHPAFGDLLFDSMGFLWIELGPVASGSGEHEYLVLDADLESAGRIPLPRLEMLEIGSDYLLGVRYDALGVGEVVLYSLRR